MEVVPETSHQRNSWLTQSHVFHIRLIRRKALYAFIRSIKSIGAKERKP